MRRADEPVFREYVSSRLDSLRRVAYLLCRDWHTADDLVSISMGKLYRHFSRVKDDPRLDGYVRKCEDGSRRVPNCRVVAGPNGSWTHERTTSGGVRTTTAVVNKSGTTVQVTSSNTARPGTPDPPPNLSIPPLDQNQLLEITLDSRLELA